MRLVNGYTDAEGRVEIMEGDGTWSTVASSVANVAGDLDETVRVDEE